MPSERAPEESVTMSSETPTVVHSPSGSAEVTRTRVTARVPARPSRMRTLKSTSWTSLSSGWRGLRARGAPPRGVVEGVAGADALADSQDPLAVDDQADGRLRHVATVVLALD